MAEETVLAGARAQSFILGLQIRTIAQMVHGIVARLLLVHGNDSRPIKIEVNKLNSKIGIKRYLRAIVAKELSCLRLRLLLKLVYMTAGTGLCQAIVPNRLLIPANLFVHEGVADFHAAVDH